MSKYEHKYSNPFNLTEYEVWSNFVDGDYHNNRYYQKNSPEYLDWLELKEPIDKISGNGNIAIINNEPVINIQFYKYYSNPDDLSEYSIQPERTGLYTNQEALPKANHSWIEIVDGVPIINIEAVKEWKKNQIAEARKKARSEPIDFDFGDGIGVLTMSSGDQSETDYRAAIDLIDDGDDEVYLSDTANNWFKPTREQVRQLLLAMKRKVKGDFMKEAQLYGTIAVAETYEETQAISW
ncbi:MAG: hypothetical protein NT007_09610 [Candidatus Kapabacteria bacterium]|nr:hypothetical protein [Candidatus Kapabacteria bacterium]